MSANRYLPAARRVARAIPEILAQRGLKPPISRFVLTETQQGNAWLFIILDVSPRDRLVETYAATDVLQHLSTAFHGHPVVFSTSVGLRYAVLLSPSLGLKKAIPLWKPAHYAVPSAGVYWDSFTNEREDHT